MIHRLFDELESLALEHHELELTDERTIRLTAYTCDEACVEEVMRIRDCASKYEVVIQWDGKHLVIH